MLLKINNRNNFVLKSIPEYHPMSLAYLDFWRLQKRRCIEGFWAPDDANVNSIDYEGDTFWRYMPGSLYFYINFGTILHRPKELPKTSPKIKVRPTLRDVDWEIHYDVLEARGFSGFEEDDEFTCCEDVINNLLAESQFDPTCFSKAGKVKQYISAREYLRRLFKEPLGRPLYRNGAKNYILLSTRELGKSFSVVGVITHELLFDGKKYYDSLKTVSTQFVGSGQAPKSLSMMGKIKDMVVNLPGSWHQGQDDYVPSPFYKEMSGSLSTTWKHSYQKKIGNTWQNCGTESKIIHGVWTAENPEAAAGERYSFIVCEEVGITPNIVQIHQSNEAASNQGTGQTGTSIYLGTGGNMEKIVQSEIIFKNPESFNMLAFEDEWEGTGLIGRFFPAIYKDEEFKDSNGNTDVKRALEHYEARRAEKKKSKDPSAINAEMVNYPLKPSEMFLNDSRNRFPLHDLKTRLSELLTSNSLLNSSERGWLVLNDKGEVHFRNEDIHPIREFPMRQADLWSINGCVEIFEQPQSVTDYFRYIASLDPVDDDDNNSTRRSLQSIFVFDTWTDRIVAEYTGRTKNVKEFYEQARRMCVYYKALLLYENQKKGIFTHFELKNSLYLLADTPEYLKDTEVSRTSSGNRSKGVYMSAGLNRTSIDFIVSWLDTKAANKENDITNTYTIRSVGLIRELILYDGVINTDRVSSLKVLMLFREALLKHVEAKGRDVKKLIDDPFFKRHSRKFNKYNNINELFTINYDNNNKIPSPKEINIH